MDRSTMIRTQPPTTIALPVDGDSKDLPHVVKTSSFNDKAPIPDDPLHKSNVRSQTEKIKCMTSELHERRRNRQATPASSPNKAAARSHIDHAYQRVATSTLVRVDDARLKLRWLEDKIAGMRHEFLNEKHVQESPMLNDLQVLEEEKRREEDELYSTIFDLQVLRDAHLEHDHVEAEPLPSKDQLARMADQITALTTENERLEQELSERTCAIEFSSAVIAAQEAAFQRALQARDDEIDDLLDRIDNDGPESADGLPIHIQVELAELQSSLAEIQRVKGLLEATCLSLHERVQSMEAEKAEHDSKLADLEATVSRQQSDIDEAAVLVSKLQLEKMTLENEKADLMNALDTTRSQGQAELDEAVMASWKLENDDAALDWKARLATQEVDRLKALHEADIAVASNAIANLQRDKEFQAARIAEMTAAILDLQSTRFADLEVKAQLEAKCANAMLELNEVRKDGETERELFARKIVLLEKETEAIQHARSNMDVERLELENANASLKARAQATVQEMDLKAFYHAEASVSSQTVAALEQEKALQEARIEEMAASILDLQSDLDYRATNEADALQELCNLQRASEVEKELFVEKIALLEKENNAALQSCSNCEKALLALETENGMLRLESNVAATEMDSLKALLQAKTNVFSKTIEGPQSERCPQEAKLEDVARKDDHRFAGAADLKTSTGPDIDTTTPDGSSNVMKERQMQCDMHPVSLLNVAIAAPTLEENHVDNSARKDAVEKMLLQRRLVSLLQEIDDLRAKTVADTGLSMHTQDVDTEPVERSTNADSTAVSNVEPNAPSDTSIDKRRALENCVRALAFLGFYVPAARTDEEKLAEYDEVQRSLDCIAELAFLFL